jgi:hypothetical protein
MLYRWLADGVVLAHGLFVLFVVGGGFLAARWPRIAWIHLPSAIWGALIEFAGWTCPLTPLENLLRQRAGQAGYSGDFVDHYILGALYPSGLTPTAQWILGALVVAINCIAYRRVWNGRRRRV